LSVLREITGDVPYGRDPLSVFYDKQTSKLLDTLYRKSSLPASAKAFVKIPPNDPPDDFDGSLTIHQRAFVRSRSTTRTNCVTPQGQSVGPSGTR
jgi:hypothetical protein